MKKKNNKCDLREILRLFGKKWTYPIFTHINKKPISFNQLYSISKHIINPTLLSNRLKDFIKYNLIKKEKVNGRITYSITPAGRELKDIILKLKSWCVHQDLNIPGKCRGKECACKSVFQLNN